MIDETFIERRENHQVDFLLLSIAEIKPANLYSFEGFTFPMLPTILERPLNSYNPQVSP